MVQINYKISKKYKDDIGVDPSDEEKLGKKLRSRNWDEEFLLLLFI